MAKSTRRSFVVVGSGIFPFDMLRYDQCWPKSESPDSSAIAVGMYGESALGLRRVTLVTDNPHAPTMGRWESFTWKVEDGSIQRVV